MDIEVNDNKQQASFRNGKFYHIFTPTTANQTVKLYHMGCVGDTRLNRIQLEQGTEPTGFVVPKQTTNTLSGIFKNLRDLDVKMIDPDSDLWTRIKKTARGTVEEYHTNTIKNEIVKTAEGIVERQTKVINSSVDEKVNGAKNELNTRVTTLTSQSKRYADEVADVLSRRIDGVTTNVSTVSRTVDSINSNITSLEGNVLKKNEISITSNGVTLGSGKVIDGRTITSLITTQPENIKAITDKFIITPANENLIKPEYRRNSSFTKDMQISEEFNIGKIKDFLVKGKARTNSYENRFRFAIRIIYKDGTNDFLTGIDSAAYINGGEFSIPFKINEREKEIKNAYFTIDRYGTPIFDELSIVPQKSAELIVDGTIEGKHIKSSTIETGHLKVGSVTANIVATNAITSNHLKVDDAMIDKLVSNQAFVTKLWAKEAFINNLESVKIKSTQINTESLRGKTITGGTIDGGVIKGEAKIQIGDHGYMRPSGDGLRFCLPEKPNANKGVGVQMLGNYGRNGTSAYGLYVYVDPNFDTREVAGTDSYLMTVNGYISARGVNNLKFTNYTDGSTAIGVWNKNVSLLFDSTDNDIFYQWKSKYSLWNIVNNYYNSTSDARLKKDIKKCDYIALDLIDDFNFKSFNWKYHEEFGQKPYTEIGLIAQDVEKINKNFVAIAGEYKTLNQFNLLTYSLKAIQELSTENKELKQRIIKLEEKVNG